jgi:drug/metabolite transporter (DMT)-like permease
MTEMLKSFGFILLTSCATVTCQLLAKYGVKKLAPLNFSERPVATAISLATSPFIISGLLVQALGFSLWLTIIARSNLTWAVGVASVFVYLLTALLNRLLLGEGINLVQGAGLLLLCVGVVLLSYQPTASTP